MLLEGDPKRPRRRTRPRRTAPPAPKPETPAPSPRPAPVVSLVPEAPAEDAWAAATAALLEPTPPGNTEDDPGEAGWTSREVVDEAVALGTRAEVSTREDALGTWLVAFDDLLRARWVWPARARALGADGTVIVRLRVHASGKLDPVVLLRGAGDAELDQAALAAIPARAAPLPDGRETLHLRYTFRYRHGTGGLGAGGLPPPATPPAAP
jgi:protein TonB